MVRARPHFQLPPASSPRQALGPLLPDRQLVSPDDEGFARPDSQPSRTAVLQVPLAGARHHLDEKFAARHSHFSVPLLFVRR